MKRSLIYCGILVLAVSGKLGANPEPQPQVSFTEGASGTWNADWSGTTLRTYFLEWSLDLVNWDYAPLVEFGTGVKSFGINNHCEKKYFVRLHYVDDTTVTTLQEAKDADFDNDGIPSWFEVEQISTDPFDKSSAGGDPGGNGIADGYELFHFWAIGASGMGDNPDGDGLVNQIEILLGMNAASGFDLVTSTEWEIYLPN